MRPCCRVLLELYLVARTLRSHARPGLDPGLAQPHKHAWTHHQRGCGRWDGLVRDAAGSMSTEIQDCPVHRCVAETGTTASCGSRDGDASTGGVQTGHSGTHLAGLHCDSRSEKDKNVVSTYSV